MKFATMMALMLAATMALPACEQPPKEEPWVPARRQREKYYARPLPPGQLALRKIPPELYPDFSRGYENRAGLEEAILHSLSYLARPSSQKYFPYGDISHARAVATLNAFLDVLQSARSPKEFDEVIRRDFDVYQSVGCDDQGTVLFTGYYTPIFDGRMRPEGDFRYPLYALPPEVAKDAEGRTLGWRAPDGSLGRCPTRRDINERGVLAGREIAWLRDPFEVYIATVQGSVRLRQADGSIVELGYAGNNGYEYTSIGQLMIRDGVIDQNSLSLPTLRAYFRDHPDQVDAYCNQNDRYVFFKPEHGGPFGSINVPVTPYRTIATDKEVFPRACLAFLGTSLPVRASDTVENQAYAGFALDQDTGGAIRAAGRSDVFFGIGSGAEALAGRTLAEGALYYIFVKSGADASAR